MQIGVEVRGVLASGGRGEMFLKGGKARARICRALLRVKKCLQSLHLTFTICLSP